MFMVGISNHLRAVRVNLSVQRLRRYSTDVNILDKIKEYPCIKPFMNDGPDPVKDKWNILCRYRDECLIDPNIEERRFYWIRQQYELFSLHNESAIDHEFIDCDEFLSAMKKQTADPGSNNLTLKQFEVTKQKLNVLKFRKIIDQLMAENRNIVKQLYGVHTVWYYKYLERQLRYWTTYHHGSYGHPYITEIYDNLMMDGNITVSQMLDVLYYVRNLQDFQWNYGDDNGLQQHNKNFGTALKFFRKHDIRMEDDQYFIHNDSRSLRHTLQLKEFWQIQTERYFNLRELIDDIVKDEKIKGDIHQVETYIVSLYRMDDDPFFKFLWNNLSNMYFQHEKENLKQRIYNRWNIDINGSLKEHCDILMPLLYRDNSLFFDKKQCAKIDSLRNAVLLGGDLNEYINDIKMALSRD